MAEKPFFVKKGGLGEGKRIKGWGGGGEEEVHCFLWPLRVSLHAANLRGRVSLFTNDLMMLVQKEMLNTV